MKYEVTRSRPQALEWLLIAAGLVLVWHYAWIMDDAFVYARYADNAVVSGLGLVYNHGEFVEGYSSPLWMLWLLLPRALGLNYWLIWVGTGLLSFAATAWLLVRLDRELDPTPAPTRSRVNLPLAFLAPCYGVTSYFTSGLESPFVQLCAAGYAIYFVRHRSRAAQLLVGLSPLVRPELALPFGFALLFTAIRARSLRAVALPAMLGILSQAAWLAFRVYYYADLLPNTFYLKHEYDPLQGWHYFVNTFYSYHVEVLLLAALLAGYSAYSYSKRERRTTAPREAALNTPPQPALTREQARPRRLLGSRLAMLAAAILVTLYVIRIGGDAIHFRFLAFPFVLVVCACGGLFAPLVRRLAPAQASSLCALITLTIAALSLRQQPPQRRTHALFGAGQTDHVDRISDPGWHRSRTKFRTLALEDLILAPQRALAETVDDFSYTRAAPYDNCARAYWHYDERIVHSLGLTDPILARLTIPSDRPGHRYGLRPYARSLVKLYSQPGRAPRRGAFREATLAGAAPPWVEKNLPTLEMIESKSFNRHDFWENLELALTVPRQIVVSR